MKRFLLQVIIIISPFSGSAQTIGYLDLPVVGELWIEFKDTVGANFTLTPAGLGQTWNYLNSFTVHDTVQFLPQMTSAAPANISSLYPQANLVSQGDLPGDYTFVRTDLTGMFIDGVHSNVGFDIAGNMVNDINYDVDLLYLPIPFGIGDVIQNTSSFSYVFTDSTLLPGALIRATYTTFQDMETDAQGELTTPLGNYPSVIRVVEMITQNVLYEIDSFALGNYTYFTDFPSPTTYAYKWLKNGPNTVVMTATSDEFNNVTSVSYFSSGGLVGANAASAQKNEITLQPNPVNKGENLSLLLKEQNKGATLIAIYDLSGREVYQTQINDNQSKVFINTAIFESGLYYLNVINHNQILSALKFAVID
jgi:hypothetical protein